MTQEQKQVVIIGGSFAGIEAAKSIFKRKNQSVKVTLISSSTHAYFNIATPRLIVEPEHIEKTLFPVKDTLAKYANGVRYRLVHGTVESTDFKKKSIVVEASEGSEIINYDYLIIASGAKSDSSAFKLGGDYHETVESIKQLNKSTKSAKKIVVLGGGATGVETAGELGDYYGKEKEIVLYTGLVGPLYVLGESASQAASKRLAGLGVKVINRVRSTKVEANRVTFDDGSVAEADIVIPAYGLFPNSQFLDKKFVDANGYLKTDKHLRVEGYNVIGLGDILSIGESSIVNLVYAQLSVFEATVDYEIFENKTIKLKPYSATKQTLLVPVSKNGGVGKLFGWSFPSFLVKILKSKDFMIPKANEHLF